MKQLFSKMLKFSITLIVLFALQTNIFAGEGDTLVVYATDPPLNEVINSDTTAAGDQVHSVYKLVSLDTTYIFLGPVLPNSDITVIGELGEDGRPPCIQPGVLNDGSIPAFLFRLTVPGQKGVFKNLYFLDQSTNASYHQPGYDIFAVADSIEIFVDNVIFDSNQGFAIGYTGNWCDFEITNSKFRNGVAPSTWTDSEGLAPQWPSAPAVDTVLMRNNTFFSQNAYAAVMKTPARYLEFSHNNFVFSFLQPLFVFPVFEAKINNNIFYSPWVGGHTKEEYPWWFQMFSPAPPGIIDLDTMDIESAEVFAPEYADEPDSVLRMEAEAKRKVEVKNNLYHQPQAVKDHWEQWNEEYGDTKDSLYTPVWMNSRTQNMFEDKETWPGFTKSGNMIGVDPGFGASFDNVLHGGDGYGIGLLEYFDVIRKGETTTIGWGYQLQTVSGSPDWVPYWPLPETDDMKYTNESVKTGGTDGKPIGDLNWFPEISEVSEKGAHLPKGFELYDAYPNPFNPKTNIKFSIPRKEFVNLGVYNVLGQKVAELVSEQKKAGTYTVTFNGSSQDLSSGIYFYRLKCGNMTISKKMMLLK